MRDYLSRRHVPDSKLRVVGNWAVDEPEQPIPAGDSQLRRSLGLDAHFVVGYSGNLGLTHDYSTLLGAAERLRTHEDVMFLMVGGGAGMRELETQAKARGLMNFRFLPYQARDRLADSLAAADVHLVTQLPAVEGLMVPSKIYGVMAVGRPVVFVGDEDGEVARAVERAGCGVAASVGDPDQLVTSLLSLKADAPMRARLGASAADAYAAHHRFDAVATRWVQLLNELTN
jgi:glycosyltransferase involved in cell wall biosynthesis